MLEWIEIGSLTDIPRAGTRLVETARGAVALFRTTDDAVFTNATGALKQEAAAIKAEKDKLKKIADDVGKAAQVAGYIAQALTFIATLPKLP